VPKPTPRPTINTVLRKEWGICFPDDIRVGQTLEWCRFSGQPIPAIVVEAKVEIVTSFSTATD
jgi:hypothetical protein